MKKNGKMFIKKYLLEKIPWHEDQPVKHIIKLFKQKKFDWLNENKINNYGAVKNISNK